MYILHTLHFQILIPSNGGDGTSQTLQEGTEGKSKITVNLQTVQVILKATNQLPV